MCGKPISYHDI
jgi:E3 ubiquitin-protein ligase HUWE1